MTSALVSAFVARVASTGIPTGEGVAPAGASRYAVVWAGAGSRRRVGDDNLGVLGDPFRDVEITGQVTCVGTTAEQARLVADIVSAAVLGHVLTVTGWVCQPITLDSDPPPIRRDDDVNPPLFVLPLLFEFRANPA